MRLAPFKLATLCLAVAGWSAAQAQTQPHQKLLRDIFQELVEINTVTATGDTLKAAEAMAARLRAAGFPAEDVKVLSPGPRKGNLVARLRGSGARKPIMLLAHLDVVEARREDWSTDPFKLVEKDGYFYGRGTADDKFMGATFVANLIRYKQEGFKPDRDLLLVLETDEEILDADTAGIGWLIKHHRPLIDAEFALNEGAGIGLRDGKPIRIGLQTSEKVSFSFKLEARGAGGHSSVPSPDSPIYRLAAGLSRLATFNFPMQLNETTRGFFAKSALLESGPLAADMKGVAAEPPDAAAVARLTAQPVNNAQMRTTCVATMLEGGHAYNALPQMARATVNCRILPGVRIEEVQKTLVQVMADEQISVTPVGTPTLSPPSPLEAKLVQTIERVAGGLWPGITLVPIMSAGATDGSHLRNAGIPTYGHSGLGTEIGENRAHGRDERVRVQSFYEGQEYLYRLVKELSKP